MKYTEGINPVENNIFDMVSARAFGVYWEKLVSNQVPFLGAGLFPNLKKKGLTLEWIVGEDNLPVMLQPSAFDAKPMIRDRGGVGNEAMRMPFFREAMHIKEEDRQQLLEFEARNNTPYLQTIVGKIFDDTANLVQSAEINAEVMRMGILTKGAFTIASANNSGQAVTLDYNYDPNGKWDAKNNTTLVGNAKWSDHANSNPVQDIIDLKRQASARGINLTRMIIGPTTWLHLVANEKIKLGIVPLAAAAANVVLTDSQIKTFIESMTGIRIAVYDKMYKDLDGVDQSFYPTDGCATFLPGGTLGNTYFGTTPEEADLMSGRSLADVSIVNTGVAVCTEKLALPVNIINWVSAIMLPSFPNINQVFNIKF